MISFGHPIAPPSAREGRCQSPSLEAGDYGLGAAHAPAVLRQAAIPASLSCLRGLDLPCRSVRRLACVRCASPLISHVSRHCVFRSSAKARQSASAGNGALGFLEEGAQEAMTQRVSDQRRPRRQAPSLMSSTASSSSSGRPSVASVQGRRPGWKGEEAA